MSYYHFLRSQAYKNGGNAKRSIWRALKSDFHRHVTLAEQWAKKAAHYAFEANPELRETK